MSDFDANSVPFPIEWLAGYLDGELTSEESEQVERILRSSPEFRSLLDTQRAFAPNVELARKIAPPAVSDARWTRVFVGIEMGLETPEPTEVNSLNPPRPSIRRSRWSSLALAIGSVTLASIVGLVGLLIFQPQTPIDKPVTQSEEFEEPIRVVSAHEVQILSLDESAAVGLVVGEHPLDLKPVVLARFDEVDLHGVEPDLQGEYPELQMTPHGASSPMIWARSDLRVAKNIEP